MKKRDVKRRFMGLWNAAKEYFMEEEPREKARRTLKEASSTLNRTVYQRIALEYELEHSHPDPQTRQWMETTLDALKQTEAQHSSQLAMLRNEYRKLAVQDVLYRALDEPNGDTFQHAHEALMELSASVETQKSIQSLPRLLEMDMQTKISLPTLTDKENDHDN